LPKNHLKKKLCTSLLTLTILSGLSLTCPNYTYAAAADAVAVADAAANDPNTFTARIQKILDEYHQNRNRIVTPQEKSSAITTPQAGGTTVVPTTDLSAAPVEVNKPTAPTGLHEDYFTYNFDWQGTPIAQSLYAVAKEAHKSVVVNGQLSGDVYTSLQGVTCAQALDYLSRSFNFNWMEDPDSNAIIVSTADIMKQSRIFEIHFVDKDKIAGELGALGIDAKGIYANTETGTISVTGTPYQLQEAAKRIKAIDNPVSQCLILAQLIDISHGHNLDLGMQYTLPTYSFTTSSTNLTYSVTAAGSRELSKGKVIARPMVMMLNGQEGTVNFGDKVPVLTTTTTSSSTEVTVDYKDVGTTLKVTPVIDKRTNEVSMKIDAEISNISSWVTSGSTKAPQISVRHATTSAHLKSGQSFVIGGLMNVNELDNLSGIPGLMDLPILGKLFSYHSVTKTYDEIYIMITPYIVTDDIDPKTLLQKVGE